MERASARHENTASSSECRAVRQEPRRRRVGHVQQPLGRRLAPRSNNCASDDNDTQEQIFHNALSLNSKHTLRLGPTLPIPPGPRQIKSLRALAARIRVVRVFVAKLRLRTSIFSSPSIHGASASHSITCIFSVLFPIRSRISEGSCENLRI